MKTEAHILQNLMSLRQQQNKTIILITQRLPELINADHILVLDHGRIMEQGNHEQLLRTNATGWYAKIFYQQAKALLQPLAGESVVKPTTLSEAPLHDH